MQSASSSLCVRINKACTATVVRRFQVCTCVYQRAIQVANNYLDATHAFQSATPCCSLSCLRPHRHLPDRENKALNPPERCAYTVAVPRHSSLARNVDRSKYETDQLPPGHYTTFSSLRTYQVLLLICGMHHRIHLHVFTLLSTCSLPAQICYYVAVAHRGSANSVSGCF